MRIGMTRGAVVLLYNVEVEKEKEIRILGMKCGIRVKKVPLSEYKKAIGYEAGIKATPTSEEVYEGEELSNSVIIMRNFNQAMINIMLQLVRTLGDIDYKAILTTTNAAWDIFRLLDELKKEQAALQARQAAAQAQPDAGEDPAAVTAQVPLQEEPAEAREEAPQE